MKMIENRSNEYSRWYVFHNNKNERVVVNISETHCDASDKKCLPNLWVKHDYMKKPVYNYLTCDTYVYEEDGTCRGKYNPTITSKFKINFDWILEATQENESKILNEVYRLSNL